MQANNIKIKSLVSVARDAFLTGNHKIGHDTLDEALKIKGFARRGAKNVIMECAGIIARDGRPAEALLLATSHTYNGSGTWAAPSQEAFEAIAGPRAITPKIGDILVESWGYDQTNIDFYQVIKVSGACVWIREISHRTTHGEGSPQETVVPCVGAFLTPHREDNLQGRDVHKAEGGARKRIAPLRDGKYSVRISSYSHARLWDGEPCHETGAMYGH